MSCQIMVPVDGSSFGQQALPLALAVAARAAATIHLVKVHVPPPMKVSPHVHFDEGADQNALNGEESGLNDLAETIRNKSGLHTCTAVLTGPVAPALEAYVNRHGISLVIMSSHGRGGLSRVWLGSIADALVRRIAVPILIVKPDALGTDRPREQRFDHLMIPLDGSPLAEQALAQAAALGELFDARYTLMQVVNPPFTLSGSIPELPPEKYHTQVEQLRREALAYLERIAAPMRERGATVDTAVIVQAQSAHGILEETSYRNADLVVMSSHGSSGYQRVALGSVADKVLRGAATPVLMFRAHAAVPELRAARATEMFA